MTGVELIARLRELDAEPIPLPARGDTAQRHERLMSVGREDLSLARLAEAHWDAVAILAEADRDPEPQVIYGVWASEIPEQPLRRDVHGDGFTITGIKHFCSGAGLIDRALVTVAEPEYRLVDIDLRSAESSIRFDGNGWNTSAFAEVNTATVLFDALVCSANDTVGGPRWYLERAGFWHGACGPAACWAGGAEGLLDYARKQTRDDAHTLAHLGAMEASVWALRSLLVAAGDEIDEEPRDVGKARTRALMVRHLVEQHCTDIIRRTARAYGPHPLAMDENICRRYEELDLYLRQSHAERDLETLGRGVKAQRDVQLPSA